MQMRVLDFSEIKEKSHFRLPKVGLILERPAIGLEVIKAFSRHVLQNFKEKPVEIKKVLEEMRLKLKNKLPL